MGFLSTADRIPGLPDPRRRQGDHLTGAQRNLAYVILAEATNMGGVGDGRLVRGVGVLVTPARRTPPTCPVPERLRASRTGLYASVGLWSVSPRSCRRRSRLSPAGVVCRARRVSEQHRSEVHFEARYWPFGLPVSSTRPTNPACLFPLYSELGITRRLLCTVLWEPGSEIPPGDPTDGLLREPESVRFEFVAQMRAEKAFPTTFMCRMLGVSASGFYAWRGRPPSQRSLDDAGLTERIGKVHQAHSGRVGMRRVHDELRRAGVACAHKRVHRLMRGAGLSGVHPKPYKRTTLPDRFNPALACGVPKYSHDC
jgi:hypothetical protein